MPTANETLLKYWGYSSFRKNQDDIIHSILDGKDTLALLPTGGGKSICYQLPTLMMDGMCVVISPLIALMKDQVEDMKQKGVKAVAITSEMSYQELDMSLTNCIFGGYKFLYLSPEKLQNKLVQKKISEMSINLIAVDEAHCISEWGHNFRPSYRNISIIRKLFPNAPLLALTATATPIVATDIQKNLRFQKNNLIQSSFVRDNISYIVRNEEDKNKSLINILNKIDGCAIIYVDSRKNCSRISNLLAKNKITSNYYHAGVSIDDRNKRQSDWKSNKIRVMVATSAFGMGIDKSDVRIVIHLHIPSTIESYFQETGRAGRDKKESYSVLLYNKSNINHLKDLINIHFPDIEEIKECYQQLGNYFQLAVNNGMEESFDFDIVEFSKKYNTHKSKINNILKYLEKENYLRLNNTYNNSSKLKIIVNNIELNRFQEGNKYYDRVLKSLLRSYSGLFDDFVTIHESTIAARLKVREKNLVDIFLKLQQLEIIYYIPKNKSSQIMFLQNRTELKHLVISEKKLIERKNLEEQKMNCMLNYCRQKTTCRNKLLLSYFGEKKKSKCGKCDICRNKR